MTSSGHTLTVAICTYNRASVLKEALESLRNQQVDDPSRVEVLVVDNGSPDNTLEVAASFEGALPFVVRAVVEPKKGLSYARNTAVKSAEGSIVAFLDDDAQATPEFAAGHLEAYDQDPDVHGVMGRVLPMWETERPDWLDPLLEPYLTIVDPGEEPFTLRFPGQTPVGANMSFLRQSLVDAGMFDVRFGVGGARQIPFEENELASRFAQRGWKMVYWPRACVYHGVPASRVTARWFIRRIVDQGRAQCVYDRDHLPAHKVAGRALTSALLRGPVLAAAAGLDYALGHRARAARRASVPVYAWGYLKELASGALTPTRSEIGQ